MNKFKIGDKVKFIRNHKAGCVYVENGTVAVIYNYDINGYYVSIDFGSQQPCPRVIIFICYQNAISHLEPYDKVEQDVDDNLQQKQEKFKKDMCVRINKKFKVRFKYNLPNGKYFKFNSFITPYMKNNLIYDCLIKDSQDKLHYFNSRYLVKANPNDAYFVHCKVVDNTVYFMSLNEIGGFDKAACGKAKCHENNKFDLKTGIILSVARAFKDKALEDYILDKNKEW